MLNALATTEAGPPSPPNFEEETEIEEHDSTKSAATTKPKQVKVLLIYDIRGLNKKTLKFVSFVGFDLIVVISRNWQKYVLDT